MQIKELKNKKVLILGLAREGESTFLFLREKFPKAVFGLADQLEKSELPGTFKRIISKNRKIKLHLGKNYLRAIPKYEIIIKTPGIPHKIIRPFVTKKQRITSQTDIFFDECQGTIIGVTGTKGKGTTSTLIYKILKKGGYDTHLLGNIGKPVLPELKRESGQSIFVLEVSSHQLADVRKSPRVSVLLNIFPEHLDYYRDFNEYFRTKQKIAKYQKTKDYLIFNGEQKEIKQFAESQKAKKIAFGFKVKNNFKNQAGKTYLDRGYVISVYGDKKERIISAKEVKLPGRFNLLNVMAAVSAARIFNVAPEKIRSAIKNFRGLPHRLEYVGKFKGIEFYNDSLATVPEATIRALETLGKKVGTIFLGGFDRGVNFESLVEKFWKMDIKALILFPESGRRIWEEIVSQKPSARKLPHSFWVQNMRDAVEIAFKYTKKGEICLLSCASPSFGLFKNYKDRGDSFKKCIRYFNRRQQGR